MAMNDDSVFMMEPAQPEGVLLDTGTGDLCVGYSRIDGSIGRGLQKVP
jgi:hypothetical protein